jgi:hypothetical protein
MASTNQPDEAPVSVTEHITLEEFCTRLSMSDRRVELIGGFHYTEVAAGRIKDAESEFQSRFTAFATKPV